MVTLSGRVVDRRRCQISRAESGRSIALAGVLRNESPDRGEGADNQCYAVDDRRSSGQVCR